MFSTIEVGVSYSNGVLVPLSSLSSSSLVAESCFISVFPKAMHKARLWTLEGHCVSSKSPLGLLEGAKDINILPNKRLLIFE